MRGLGSSPRGGGKSTARSAIWSCGARRGMPGGVVANVDSQIAPCLELLARVVTARGGDGAAAVAPYRARLGGDAWRVANSQLAPGAGAGKPLTPVATPRELWAATSPGETPGQAVAAPPLAKP